MKTSRLNSFVIIAYLLAICFVVLRNFYSPWGDVFNSNGNYSHYNNYLIFRQSFGHLLHSVNLYIPYPTEYFDLYKYPPLFALLMAPFYCLPVWLGYGIWTGINILLPIYGLRNLGLLNTNRGLVLALIVLSEAITAALNSQSNGIVIGLLLLSFSSALKENTFQSVLFIWLSAFIKIFGVLFFLIFLMFDQQRIKAALYALGVFGFFLLVPAFIGGFDALVQHYRDWFVLLENDFSLHVKYSVMGWIKSWFGLNLSKNLVILLGLVVQLLPLLLKWKSLERPSFYWPYLISLLIWMVVFNHMAESATYIIAVVPIAAWLASVDRINALEWGLGILVLLFTVLGPTDIYPLYWRKLIVETYQLKAFPCIAFWMYLLVQSVYNSSRLEEKNRLFQ